MNTFLQIRIICADKSISKVPSIFSKYIICCFKSKCTQIFNKEYGSSSCISFSKNVNLPQSRNKCRKMMNNFIHRQSFIRELFFQRKIIFKSGSQLRGTSIHNRCTIKHPFFFRNIIIPNLSCMVINSLKKFSMNRNVFIC